MFKWSDIAQLLFFDVIYVYFSVTIGMAQVSAMNSIPDLDYTLPILLLTLCILVGLFSLLQFCVHFIWGCLRACFDDKQLQKRTCNSWCVEFSNYLQILLGDIAYIATTTWMILAFILVYVILGRETDAWGILTFIFLNAVNLFSSVQLIQHLFVGGFYLVRECKGKSRKINIWWVPPIIYVLNMLQIMLTDLVYMVIGGNGFYNGSELWVNVICLLIALFSGFQFINHSLVMSEYLFGGNAASEYPQFDVDGEITEESINEFINDMNGEIQEIKDIGEETNATAITGASESNEPKPVDPLLVQEIDLMESLNTKSN